MTLRDRPDHPAELTLLDYLMDQLPPETSDYIRRHVATCRACRRTIADLEDTVGELDRLPTAPIPHDTPNVRGYRRPKRRRRTLRLLAPLALVVALAVALVTVGLERRGSPSHPLGHPYTLALDARAPQAALEQIVQGVASHAVVLAQGTTANRVFYVVVQEADRQRVSDRLQQVAASGGAGPSFPVIVATTSQAPSGSAASAAPARPI